MISDAIAGSAGSADSECVFSKRRKRKREREKKKKEDTESERNNEPLVSKTRFS